MNAEDRRASGTGTPPLDELTIVPYSREAFQTNAPANRGVPETQREPTGMLRFQRRGRIYVAARQPAAPLFERFERCTMYYVLCTMHYVLCTMYYVLCIMYYVLCTIYYTRYTIYYIRYTITTIDYIYIYIIWMIPTSNNIYFLRHFALKEPKHINFEAGGF